ncbi:unnamed protein product [Rotaria magnacalcarata]|uniref:Uncharacterized protein n=1 Tax=Rotaria magnacalcarata TaxID=392030 RepID=A0A8S2JXD4_9BILA|nr:unnamed protein product [Rotaria magnacalcarata]
MDSYNQLHNRPTQEDSFHQKIFDKVEEGKRDKDPQKCRQIIDDLMKLLKHLTADVNNYNSAFRETRPPFYMQEFQRLTDRIEVLTKARDTLTEYLHELEGQNTVKTLPYSTSYNDVTSMDQQFQPQLQYSPTIPQSNRSSPPEKPHYHHTSSTPSIHSDSSQRPRSPSMTPSNFIRVHFPNKHTTALAPRSDETLEIALESRASRHSITNLRAYTPVYMISRQPCQWDITLDRLRETEIELEENLKLNHSFIRKRFFTLTYCDICHKILLQGLRCLVCGSRIHLRCMHKSHVCHIIRQNFIRNESVCTLTGPQKQHIGQNSHGTPLPTTTNVDYFPNAIQSTMNISSNSLFQPPSTNMSSSLPSATSPIHHIPQLLLTMNGSTVTNPGSLRPSMIKPNSEGLIDAKKPAHKYISEWEIRPEDILKHGRMVGRGTYGTVYKAEVRLHGTVALKELNFVSPTPTQFQAFRNEVFALKKITHQNTLNFYGYIISPRFAIVTQWCEGSTLYKHIHILDRHWKINQLIDIARQICQGMSYLHDREIIHRDLKSSNVFLDTSAEPDDGGVSWRVKIGDFGLAAVKTVPTESFNQQFQPTGSVLWMAPEVIQQKDSTCYSPFSDVYAYGCVLFEMFSGKLPHAPISNKEQIMWLVGKGRLKIKVEQCRDDTPEAIVELIRQCSDFHREQRPKFSPEIDDTLSKFEFIFPRLQRSQSEPCLIRNPQDDLLGLSMNFGVPKTPSSNHRRFNAEVS